MNIESIHITIVEEDADVFIVSNGIEQADLDAKIKQLSLGKTPTFLFY